MAEREQPIIDPIEAYPLSQRAAHAEQHILVMSAVGRLETPISAEVVRTYGLPQSFIAEIKKMKAKFRCELSFSGEGK